MRLVLFAFSAIVLVAGVTLGVVYPKVMERSLGREIGRWSIYAQGGDFTAEQITLWPSDGSTVVTVDTRSAAPLRSGVDRAFLLLTVADAEGDEVLRQVIAPLGAGGLESPQTGVMRYSERVATLDPASGVHTFTLERGKDFDDDIVLSVDLVLNAATYQVQPNARPVGYGLIALGVLSLAFALRGRRENPNSSPPPRKWGRG